MAGIDYKHCDVCGKRMFQDARLAYHKADEDKKTYGSTSDYIPFKRIGKSNEDGPWDAGMCLGHLGDWAAICVECSKSYRTAIVPIHSDVGNPDGIE